MTAPTYSTYIIAEDHRIALPIIERYSLRRTDVLGRFRAFAGGDVLLAESRGDELRAAALVGLVLGRLDYDERTRVFHIGRAWPQGESAEAFEGELVLVNRVVDGPGGRSYLPDILLRHEFHEVALETSPPEPAHTPEPGSPGVAEPRAVESFPAPRQPLLRDNELAGIFAAGLSLLSPHQLYGLAAVERRLKHEDGGDPGAGIVRRFLPALDRLLEASAGLVRPARASIGGEVRSLLDEVSEHMHLTASQRSQLNRAVEASAARGTDPSAALKAGVEGSPVSSKQERGKRFDELKRSLGE